MPNARYHLAILLASVFALMGSADLAQGQRSLRVGVAASAGIPVGVFGDSARAGVGGLATLVYGNDNVPVGFRFDVSQQRIGGRSSAPSTRALNVTSITGNIVAALGGPYVKPYGLVGGGWYTYSDSTATSKTNSRRNHFGLNGGVGFTFPLLGKSGFFESRYHRLYEGKFGKRYIAMTTGMMF